MKTIAFYKQHKLVEHEGRLFVCSEHEVYGPMKTAKSALELIDRNAAQAERMAS